MIQARVEAAGAADRRFGRAVVLGLAAAGVRVVSDPGAVPAPPVVLALAGVTPAALDTVRTAHAGGQRVLAVLPGGDVVHADDAWRLLSSGAADVVAWDPPVRAASSIAARLDRWARVDETVASAIVRDNLVGASAAWRAVLHEIVEAALFTDAAVLVTGESGTGKELVARLVHMLDRRPHKGELIVLDCTTVVPTLSGSEFFGHERGAFTGAVAARDGAFGQADGGTLFLDEIGELPLPLQAELLRVIQEGTYKRVGSDTWRTTRFRLVSATNRPLGAAMRAGTFRADLYHRIAPWTFELPPLRERRADVPALARHFLAEMNPGIDPPPLDPAVERHLSTRPYPGNVRELRLLVARIAARHVGPGPITLGDLPTAERRLSAETTTAGGQAFGDTGAPGWRDRLSMPDPGAAPDRRADGTFADGASYVGASHVGASPAEPVDQEVPGWSWDGVSPTVPWGRANPSGLGSQGRLQTWRNALEAGVGQAVDAGVGLEALGRIAKDMAVARALQAEGRDTTRTAKRLGISERAVQARLAASRRDAGLGSGAGRVERDDA